jgi:hypothetical protein
MLGFPKKQTKDERIKELENIATHLKYQRRQLRKDFVGSLRDSIKNYSTATIDFINRNPAMAKEPYLFVDSKDKILGYTAKLEKIFHPTEEIIGIDYIDLFQNLKNPGDTRGYLRKYFSSDKEIKVNYDLEINGKTKKVIITKEKPVMGDEIDLRKFGGGKTITPIAFIPIKIEPQGLFHNKKIEKLESLIEDSSERQEIHKELVISHGWTAKEISDYESNYGWLGLVAKYHGLGRTPHKKSK